MQQQRQTQTASKNTKEQQHGNDNRINRRMNTGTNIIMNPTEIEEQKMTQQGLIKVQFVLGKTGKDPRN